MSFARGACAPNFVKGVTFPPFPILSRLNFNPALVKKLPCRDFFTATQFLAFLIAPAKLFRRLHLTFLRRQFTTLLGLALRLLVASRRLAEESIQRVTNETSKHISNGHDYDGSCGGYAFPKPRHRPRDRKHHLE